MSAEPLSTNKSLRASPAHTAVTLVQCHQLVRTGAELLLCVTLQINGKYS